ncbi:hypothetical protein ACB092_07G082600 [Castanea dentata]
MVVHSEDEAYKLYNDYAIRIGFSVRKEKNQICKKCYSDNLDDKKFKKLQTRTSCEASIRFIVTNGEWKVTHFNPTHNHELAKPEERPFLRSNRKITDAKLGVIKTSKEAGIRTISAYSYLVEEAGGFENVGFIKRDCYNVVNKQKLINVEAGDAQSLVNHFKQKQAKDPMFFYAIQVDQENRMTNFFWRDGRSRINYNSFGNTIFIDQCQAKNAIRVLFPNTCHRLCLWHISKNAVENLPRHYGIPEFKSRFNKILYNCETESKFESSWDTLLRDYNLVGNKWLNTLYENRERWCSVFSHNIFSARMKASSRSESVNNVFQHMACKTMRLTEFVHKYEKASKNMRVEELEEDFRCKQGISSQIVKNCGLLEHALSVYTRTFFKRFELEIASTLGVTHQDVYSNGESFSYEVIEGGGRRIRVVQYNSSNNTVTCKLSVQHILKRWTKDAKKDGVLCDHVKPANANDELSVTSRCNELMHSIYEIFTKTRGWLHVHFFLEVSIEESILQIHLIKRPTTNSNHSNETSDKCKASNRSKCFLIADCSLNSLPILDPPCVRLKAVTNARLKSNLEKRKRKPLKQLSTRGLPTSSSHAPKVSNRLPIPLTLDSICNRLSLKLIEVVTGTLRIILVPSKCHDPLFPLPQIMQFKIFVARLLPIHLNPI